MRILTTHSIQGQVSMTLSPIIILHLSKMMSHLSATQRTKLSLSQLFNFENDHWISLYEEQAKRGHNKELALYDLLNEDAATGNGMEVDVDKTTADILIG
jgi:hypothetical protein